MTTFTPVLSASAPYPRAADPIPCAAEHPLPPDALVGRGPQAVVVGLIRPDLHSCRTQAIASAITPAEDHAIRTTAARHRWRVADIAHFPPEGDDTTTDPVDYLLHRVRKWRADAVMVPARTYLTDRWGRDCLEIVRTVCAVVTLSPTRLWPRTAEGAPLSAGAVL
ncbi:hypothetical protein A5780_32230 [Nocardia sp. 852002-20019_SCH5090214]|jgi:hypothetical protein|uniref:Resolvase/invertase-type recombinase catalytic domain-containing protein n=2 Tax=Nocardia TaxID=1817 RepID=A0A231GUR8_9NOCA|nr:MULTISPECIES: hypothetical protein [Nocardia]MDN2495634.1 hypothetical protein [Nocardia nova]OBA49582.1 hypothetical protein A5780_32230 [Nocardia sp. 852002-20019_SCH5090214]OXR40332.1 hypothetical protein B7C42_07593 [Nocardia cerradoensis]PPJ01471.1 hypothetical protein C5E51_33555 [Nocardia nova]PPJ03250.1 hypothetical protein C5E44_34590 [Nocardia nova]